MTSQATPEPLSPSPEIPHGEPDWRKVYGHVALENVRLQLALSEAQATTPSPEIRYQLRNWHHVTCAGFGGQACNCLEQREALIAELALKEKL